MFIKCAKKITDTDLKHIETLLGFKLPDDFRLHYLKYNGGIPEKRFFYIKTYHVYVEISSFFSFKYPRDYDDSWTIEQRYIHYSKKRILPQELLPFADDLGGNYFCINLKSGEIVLVYMDLGEITTKSIRFLSNSFSDFLINLEAEGDD